MFRRLLKAFQHTPELTLRRVRLAYAVAVATDLLQLLLGPLGWVFIDEALDAIAAVAIWRLLGFHPLLLPTFVVELIPLADMLPTWTGCVAVVVTLRRRHRDVEPSGPHPGRVIDI